MHCLECYRMLTYYRADAIDIVDGCENVAGRAVLHTERVHALFIIAVTLGVDSHHRAQGIELNLFLN